MSLPFFVVGLPVGRSTRGLKSAWAARAIVAVLLACVILGIRCGALAQTYVTPKMGGGQIAAEMVHIDVFYDENSNTLHARVDDSYGTLELRPLEPEAMFDPSAPWAVLEGKAYNAQYGWNVGGFFTIPAGAAIWVERTAASPELETYEGSGKVGSYLPILGTGGSPIKWKWSGVMVHNTYAVWKPVRDRFFAEYLVYFADEVSGSRDAFLAYDDTQVRLEWSATPSAPPCQLSFGAAGLTNGAPLLLLNPTNFLVESGFVLNFLQASHGAPYEAQLPMRAVPATAANGGPAPNHAALGACLEIEIVSFEGPPGGRLAIWGQENSQPLFEVWTGSSSGTNRIRLTGQVNTPEADPSGCFEPGRFTLSQPGLYTMGFRVVDTSTNGTAGGPIHLPSRIYQMYVQAGQSIAAFVVENGVATVTFGGVSGRSFFLERASQLGAAPVWETVAGPLDGEDRLQSLNDPLRMETTAFYRVRSE